MSAHWPCANTDLVPAFEYHLTSCAGTSLSPWRWLDEGAHKIAPMIMMQGFANYPLGLGHNVGRGRIHVLICMEGAVMSAAQSLLATISSSCKPVFSSHKTQVNAGGARPMSTYVIPGHAGYSGSCCGGPVSITLSHPNNVTSILVGMTLGDIIGGVVNFVVEALVNTALALIGVAAGMEGGPAASFAVTVVLSVLGAAGFTVFGMSNIGVFAQMLIDQDGITHDAGPEITILGMSQVYNASDNHWHVLHPWTGEDLGPVPNTWEVPAGEPIPHFPTGPHGGELGELGELLGFGQQPAGTWEV